MYTLDPKTRQALNAYAKRVATLNNADIPSAPFDVLPHIEQKMIDQYAQQTDFLKRINITQVKHAHGQKLGLGVNKSVAKNTNTDVNPRKPTNIFGVEAVDEYLCTNTDYDICLPWKIIDNWGCLPDFQKRCANLVVQTIAQDKQKIGFNGKTRDADTDPTADELLTNVNIGWLEKMRLNNAERVIADKVIGKSQEFKSLDALVEMAIHELIGENHRMSGDLVVICSPNLVQTKYINLINQDHAPTEQQASQALYQTRKLGTLDVDTPSFIPEGTLLITSYDNLSIYLQKASHRRFIVDEPKWDRTVDYHSVNECFVVEDYTKAVLFDNVTLEK